jgi:hypothetical protein
MLVDQFLGLNGCNSRDHDRVQGNRHIKPISMSQFVEERQSVLDLLGEDGLPDFAKDNQLPKEFRANQNGEDEWKERCRDRLSHVSTDTWEENSPLFESAMTNADCCNLCLGHEDDLASSTDKRERRFAQGDVTLDIDSVLAAFTDLSVINTPIRFSIVSNPSKNLQHSVHLCHGDIPFHHIPHFHLGTFSHNPDYDLFMMLLALHSKGKRRKGKLYNHVPNKVRRAFMTKVFLPSVKEVLNPNERQAWQFNYDIAEANSTAKIKEGNLYATDEAEGRFFEVHADLGAEHIDKVWQKCERRLRRMIDVDDDLKCFRGFQFFINAKGFKHRMNRKQFGDLMNIYKERVIVPKC